MRQAILAFLLFALSMVAMSAPTNQTQALYRRKPLTCTRRGANLNHKGSSPSKKPVPQVGGAPSSKGASRPRVNRQHSSRELYERDRGIQLCKIYSFRGNSASRCRNNPGFINNVWVNWGQFKEEGLQCEHTLELQLTVNALEAAGFCKALDSIKAVLLQRDSEKDVAKKLEGLMYNQEAYSPKLAANSPEMLFFVDAAFNSKKKTWTSTILRGHSPTDADTNAKMKAYFSASVIKVVDSVAQKTDTAASKFLERAMFFVENDLGSERKRPAIHWATEEDALCYGDLQGAMHTAVTAFQKNNKAVEDSWKKMKAELAKY